MEQGITPASDGLDGTSWNVVGHTYTPKLHDTDDGRGRRGNMLVRDIAYYPSGFAFR